MEKLRKKVALGLVLALLFTMMPNGWTAQVEAAKAPKLNRKSVSIRVGKTYKLKVKNLSSKAKKTWKSSKKKVATVSKTGKVKAKKKGTANVTVSFRYKGKKKTLRCKVKVTKKTQVKATTTPTSVTTPGTSATPSTTVKPSASATPSASAIPSTSASPSASVGPTPPRTVEPSGTPIVPYEKSYDFTEDAQGFTGRGDATVATGAAIEASALLVSDRNGTWNGAQKDLGMELKAGSSYRIKALVSQETGSSQKIDMSFQVNNGNDQEYPCIAQGNIESGVWTKLEADVVVPSYDKLFVFFQMPENNTADFAIKEISFVKIIHSSEEAMKVESLALAAEESGVGFSMGTVISHDSVQDLAYRQVIEKHFNSLSCGNEMKAYSLLDQNACKAAAAAGDEVTPKMDYTKADRIVQFASDNGIGVRGHTLVWDASMCDWFFREGYQNNGAYVTRDVLLKRVENYIKEVVNHFAAFKLNGTNTKTVYCWDVVNEAVSDGAGEHETGDTACVRTKRDGKSNMFYEIIGHDYVKKAFEYARKYAPAETKLFYNDFNCIYPNKRNAICNLMKEINSGVKLADGVGMQSYNDMSDGILMSYSGKNHISIPDAIDAFAALGLEVHMTEMTVRNRDGSDSALARHANFYYQLFEKIKEMNKTEKKVTNVSIWGICDSPNEVEGSYTFNLCGTYYGILDENYKPKQAFKNILQSLQNKPLSELVSYIEDYESGVSYNNLFTKGGGGSGNVITLASAKSGTHVLEMTATADWHGPQYIYSNFGTSTVNIKLSAYVCVPSGTQGLRFAGQETTIGGSESSTIYPSSGNATVGTEWTHLTGTFALPAGKSITVRVAMKNGDTNATYYVDDFAMVVE